MAEIPGTTGDDVLVGTSGSDTVNASYGNDTITTLGGDDVIVDLGWLSNSIDSGDGNDRISLELQFGSSVFMGYVATSTIVAGAGDDLVRLDAGMLGTTSIDLGAGNDTVYLGERYFFYDHSVALTLGSGVDRIAFGEAFGDLLRASFDVGPIVANDFVAGNGGDVIDLGAMLIGWRESDTPLDQFTGGNPFASGHLLLVQDGADTIVRLDYDGSGPGTGPTYLRDLIRLTNVTASSLTAANFGGFDPGGTANAASVVTGTSGIDLLFAAPVGSTVNAGNGADEVYGSGGADTVYGGIGNDRIDGGYGNDTLNGEDGDDWIEGGRGNDTLNGGDGNDVLSDVGGGNDSFSGGLGDDVIEIVRPTIAAGDPYFGSALTISGGDGNDRVSITVNRFDGWGSRSVTTTFNADLGLGNDYIYIANGKSTGTLTLGAGQDRVELGGGFNYLLFNDFLLNDPVSLTITDFTAGAGGDVLDLNQFIQVLVSNPPAGFNPFTAGYVRLIASGSDTIIAIDYDGENGTDSLDRLILLQGVSPASLTAENFAGISPRGGSPVGVVRSGTAQADLIWGTNGNDTLSGNGGDDRIDGGVGNDQIDGGAGNDAIYSDLGSSQLIGGTGDDLIVSSGAGSKTIDGGDGNDRLIVDHRLSVGADAVVVSGGIGNDLVDLTVIQAPGATLNVDLGDGADQVIFRNALAVGATVTTGAGTDRITLDQDLVSQALFTITVTDFQTGAGGDVFDWAQYIRQLRPDSDFYTFFDEDGSAGFNPFAEDRARLVQSGSDVLLQVAYSGPGDTFQTLAVFQNTTATAFTAYNLGFDPLFPTVASTGGDDVFAGTAGADIAYGGAGNDQLAGLDGNDLLDGGDGNDTLSGGNGNDFLRGGNGVNTILGGAGDDRIEAVPGTDQINGGDGNDRIYMSGSDTALGGAGDDQIFLRFNAFENAGWGSIDAGDGNDLVVLYYTADLRGVGGTFAVNLGAGNDHLITDGSTGPITLGLGQDLVEFRHGVGYSAELTITDFQTGNSGDVFALGKLLFNTLGLDPFTSGALELVQVGTTVELRTTAVSGWVGAYDPFTIRFLNTNLADFTAYNLDGHAPGTYTGARPVILTGDYTVAAGTVIDLTNPLDLKDGWMAPFVYQPGPGGADFVNHGSVTVRIEMGGALGAFSGFAATQFPNSIAPGMFLNAADGRYVGNLGDGYASSFPVSFLASTPEVSYRNDGWLEFNANDSSGIGFNAEGTTQAGPFVNTGTLRVTSDIDAIGVQMRSAGSLDNSGTIEAIGGEWAVGVYNTEFIGQSIRNTGTIIATTGPNSPYASIGILSENAYDPPPGQSWVYTNEGTITADIAFLAADYGDYVIEEKLINSGTLNGAVMLSGGDDSVINTGSMDSRTLLGEGDDSYDGTAGTHDGSVEGGQGNDRLLGGSGGEYLFGDAGNDLVLGGGGDDLLEGGLGADLLDGGAGFDILSFLSSPLAVTIDLDAQTAITSLEVDYVRQFEQVIGSAAGDTIRGSAAVDVLLGYRGNDVIDGRGGNDVIWGGKGADVMTGGAGFDRFLFESGDGADEITDLGLGDKIEIYGYTAYQSLVQQGADVRIVLSATDSILVRGATTADLSSKILLFSGAPTGVVLPDLPSETILLNQNLAIAAGTEITLTDTVPFRSNYVVTQSTAFALNALPTEQGVGLWNAGTITFTASEPVSASYGVAQSFINPYGGRDHWFVNQLGGTLSVSAAQGSVYGTLGVGAVFNSGTISVTALNGNASAVSGLTAPWYFAPVQGAFLNEGTINVTASGRAMGIDQGSNSASANLIYNSGQILVHGSGGSVGIENRMSAHSLADPQPQMVNTGTITVTDNTAALDSAGVLIGVAARGSFWNSGTITADYAIRYEQATSFAPWLDYNLRIYNTGTLNGHVSLGTYWELLVNNGTINGDVWLGGSNDTYDGRLGQVSGVVDGYDGEDTLLGGAGNEVLLGGMGADRLSGGGGNDSLTGGLGIDGFRFGPGYGADVITDFEIGANHDWIEVESYTAYQSIVQQGADVVITFAPGDTLTVRNVLVADLSGVFVFNDPPYAARVIPAAPAAPIPPAPNVATQAQPTGYFPLAGTPGVDNLVGGNGPDQIRGLDGADRLTGGLGNDDLTGGSNVDTAVFSGNRSAYTITQTSTGVFQVVGPDGTDTLTTIEYAQFADQTLRLLPGTGTAVDFNAPASTWMGSIRDFDGNNLGGASSWKLIGAADIDGDGDFDRILVNREIGRFAEVATGPDGLVYFSDHGWAGETRVVGIYIDPEVVADPSKAGGPFDSQRRFQNDLFIDNIAGVLGAGDYDHDGLQEVYFRLTDGTAYLHAYMHADGNIRYANYQSQQQVVDFLTANGWNSSTWAGWFPAGAEAPPKAPSFAADSFGWDQVELASLSATTYADDCMARWTVDHFATQPLV